MFLFLSHKTDFLQTYLLKTTTCEYTIYKLNFIQQVCLQNFLIKHKILKAPSEKIKLCVCFCHLFLMLLYEGNTNMIDSFIRWEGHCPMPSLTLRNPEYSCASYWKVCGLHPWGSVLHSRHLNYIGNRSQKLEIVK